MSERKSIAAIIGGGFFIVIALTLFSFQNCGRLTDSSGTSVPSYDVTNTISAGGPTPVALPTQAGSPTTGYQDLILADSPTFYWRLSEASGSTLADIVGGNTASISGSTGSYTMGVPGAIVGDPNAALNLATGYSLVTAKLVADPVVFSEEFWFRTTVTGGDFVSFGNVQGSGSTAYDRQIYMSNSGQIYFGVYTTTPTAINSPAAYNDGSWHHVVGTFVNSTGLIDGTLVASGSPISTNAANGYVHIGANTCSGWPSAPSNCAYTGDLDEVAIYPSVLSGSQITNHYNKGRGL